MLRLTMRAKGRNTPFTSASVTNDKAGLVGSVSGMGGSLKRGAI